MRKRALMMMIWAVSGGVNLDIRDEGWSALCRRMKVVRGRKL